MLIRGSVGDRMRRKSERTVKSSPIKKTEPSSRRSTRRGRKSPEKSPINEEESDNSSDQASSSENEPEEVVAPKRSRRTSRTIEKSSSAEEIKATPSRTRRRGAAKKDADIPEEEKAGPDQATTTTSTIEAEESKESETVEESVENPETTSVDSSTEPVTEQMQNEKNSSNSVEEENEKLAIPIEIETEKESKDKPDNATSVEAKPEPSEQVESSKSRRRTLKRIERQTSNEEAKITPESTETTISEPVDSEVDTHEKSPKKPAIEEVKSSMETNVNDTSETPNKSPELQNGNTLKSDAADTTAKDTTASETDSITKLTKKKPIVRKRKWLTNKTAAPKVQEIAISTDSLKGLISDVKPVPLSDVKLESSPEADHESDDVKVVSSTSIDYNRRSEEHLIFLESTEDAAVNITTSRKISIVTESEGEQPLSPAKHNPCNILYITNLVRPFTVLQLKSLLQRTGKIAEDGFWIDKIKSKCFVKYETEE